MSSIPTVAIHRFHCNNNDQEMKHHNDTAHDTKVNTMTPNTEKAGVDAQHRNLSLMPGHYAQDNSNLTHGTNTSTCTMKMSENVLPWTQITIKIL
jgi:hypothetical protein